MKHLCESLLGKPPAARGACRSTRPSAVLAAALLAAGLSGCIVVPQTQNVYDPDCKTHTRQVTLEAAYLGGFHHCVGDGCVALLATVGLVTAASVVVSGSIAVVGNVVYWLEKQGRCVRPAALAPAQAPAARAASAPQ